MVSRDPPGLPIAVTSGNTKIPSMLYLCNPPTNTERILVSSPKLIFPGLVAITLSHFYWAGHIAYMLTTRYPEKSLQKRIGHRNKLQYVQEENIQGWAQSFEHSNWVHYPWLKWRRRRIHNGFKPLHQETQKPCMNGARSILPHQLTTQTARPFCLICQIVNSFHISFICHFRSRRTSVKTTLPRFRGTVWEEGFKWEGETSIFLPFTLNKVNIVTKMDKIKSKIRQNYRKQILIVFRYLFIYLLCFLFCFVQL